jgi:hypothetical protein
MVFGGGGHAGDRGPISGLVFWSLVKSNALKTSLLSLFGTLSPLAMMFIRRGLVGGCLLTTNVYLSTSLLTVQFWSKKRFRASFHNVLFYRTQRLYNY